MKFRFHMFIESYDELGNVAERKEKDVDVAADTCCEAQVIASRGNREWTITGWEPLEKMKPAEFVPENKFEKEAWEKAKEILRAKEKAEKEAASPETK